MGRRTPNCRHGMKREWCGWCNPPKRAISEERGVARGVGRIMGDRRPIIWIKRGFAPLTSTP